MNNDWKEKALATAANLGKKIGMILLAMLVASLFLLIGGYDFFAIFKGVWIGITSDFAGTIRWTTPLLFASLAVLSQPESKPFQSRRRWPTIPRRVYRNIRGVEYRRPSDSGIDRYHHG